MTARLASLAATVIGNSVLVLATLVCSLLVLLAAWLRIRRAVDPLIRCWARAVILSAGIRIVSPPAESWPRLDRCIVMANHTSIYDIPVLLLTTPWRLRFLAKRQLFKLPLFGPALSAAGFVPVQRGRRRSGARTFAAARKVLDGDCSLVIFPEETRSTDGKLLRFRAGGALLAMTTGIAVLPVGIRGALQVRPRDSRMIRPGTISVHYGVPLAPREFNDRKQLNAAIRRQIAQLIG